jgi:hypothetical protein
MTTWTLDDLAMINSELSLLFVAGSEPHPGVEIGMVVVQGSVYVRAFRGPRSSWYQAAKQHGIGHITCAGEKRDVLIHQASIPAVLIDRAYGAKYGGSSSLLNTASAREATLEIMPA